MARALRIITAATLLCLAACGDDDQPADAGTDAGSDAGDAMMECTKRWTLTVPEGSASTVTQADGAFSLTAPAASAAPEVQLLQLPAEGSFIAGLRFEGLTAGGPGVFLRLVATEQTEAALTASAEVVVGTPTVLAAVHGDGEMESAELDVTDGEFLFLRAGDFFSVIAESGEKTVTASSTLGGPVSLAIEFGTRGDPAPGPSSVRITDFSFTGNEGTVSDDTFDCDSVNR